MAAPTISTVSTFNMTRDQICRRALRQLQVIEFGETPSSELMSVCTDALNAWTKEQQASGLHLWTETEGVIIPRLAQVQYLLGTGTSDMAVNSPSYSVLLSGSPAGTVVLPIVPPVGLAVGDTLVVQDVTGGFNGGIVTAFTLLTVTIASPGLPNAAATNAPVISWHPTSIMARPLRILSLRRYNLLSKIVVPLMPLARLDFRGLPNQQQVGIENSWFYDPQLTFGQLWLWLAPGVPVNDVCQVTYMRPLNDWTDASNIGDFPQEWVNAITWNLARELLPEFGVPAPQMQLILTTAAEKLDFVQGFDKEPESVFFGYATDPGAFR